MRTSAASLVGSRHWQVWTMADVAALLADEDQVFGPGGFSSLTISCTARSHFPLGSPA